VPILHPPRSTVAVTVSERRAEKLLAAGWTATGGADPEPAGNVCTTYGFEAKTKAGLSAHSRKHVEE
jgi:hypothetical protein